MILILGVPGAGKSTVMKSVLSDKDLSEKYVRVSYGDYLEKEGIDRDKFRSYSIDEQQEFQKKVFPQILKIETNGKEIILDTHAYIRTLEGFLPGLPSFSGLDPRRIILFNASTDEIQKRIMNDPSRDRSDFIKNIDFVRDFAKRYSVAYSVYYSSPLTIIDNSGNPEIAVEQVKTLLRKWCEGKT